MRKSGIILPLFLACLVGLASSCANRMGWGVVIWTLPGNAVQDAPLPTGSIVPVYLKSMIGKIFVIGLPDSPQTKREIEQWRLQLFPTRRQAARRVTEFGEYLDVYMSATRDGVPLRDKPTNSARRVFRLRNGQSVKVLEKVEGEPVTTGGKPLAGDWYKTIADDGTSGYVFSYAMRLYRESESSRTASAGDEDFPAHIDAFFSNTWRPDWYRDMIDSRVLDLDRFALKYGLFADAVKRQIRIELPGRSESYNYTAISESSGSAVFEGTPLRVSFPGENRIVANWPDSQDFVLISEDLQAEIRKEELARKDRLSAFVSAAASAMQLPATSTEVSMSSPDSGSLTLTTSGRFAWTGREVLPPGFLPPDSSDSGRIVMRLVVDAALSAQWSGAFSLDFTGTGSPVADFLFRAGPEGLTLARATAEPGSVLVMEADPAGGNVIFPSNR